MDNRQLELLPLDAGQLRLLAEDMAALEKRLGIAYRAEPMEGEFLEIIQKQADILERDEENRLWQTFWLLIRREDRVAVGSLCFKGPPDARGQVEIGYGLAREFRGRGFMSEAVETVCGWALAQPKTVAVVAETLKDNSPSQRVLRRCGFSPFHEKGEYLWWKRKKTGRGAG